MEKKIKCHLTSTKGELFARLYISNYLFIVPPHRGDIGLTNYTNEKELKDCVKKLLCEAVDGMEIEHESH